MSTPVVPRPYPGCGVCSDMVREWAAVTETASPECNRDVADLLAAGINAHRRYDEAQAPAL